MMGVPYVGCGVLASAACMDKHYTKVLLAAAGIPVAPGITLDARSFDKASEFKANADAIMRRLAKPACSIRCSSSRPAPAPASA